MRACLPIILVISLLKATLMKDDLRDEALLAEVY